MRSMAAGMLVLALLVPAVLAETSFLKQMQGSQFSGFVNLLEHADVLPVMESALKSNTPLTIFAPTDDALMFHTSPILLAFLKMPENKASLKQLLLSHVAVGRLSPFQWEGKATTLAGSPVKLSMDDQAFYANDVALMQYNALSGRTATVHSLPSLMIPAGIESGARSLVEGSVMRRVLAANAPAPAAKPPPPPKKGASAQAVLSLFSLCAATLAALAL